MYNLVFKEIFPLKIISRVLSLTKFDKRSTSSMILFLGSAQMFSNVVRVISGLLVTGFVLPEVLGTFNSFGLIIQYLPILQFGIMNGLNRELPFYLGQGKVEKAREFASAAQYWELSLSLLVFSVLTILSVYHLIHSNFIYAAGFFTFAISAVHHYYGLNYLQVLYRTNQDFNKLSSITVIISIISLLSVFFVWKWDFFGLCIRSVILVIFEMTLLWRWKPISVKPRFELHILKDIGKVGLPIFIVGLIFFLWGTIQNTLVPLLGGAKQFGLFSLALMIESSLAVIALSVSQVVYPKMSFEYGAGKKLKDLLSLSFKPILAVFLLLIPSIIIAWILLPFLIEWFLPKYVEGIEAARWTMLLIFISIWGVNNNVFNVLNKQKDYLLSIIIGIIVFAATLFSFHFINGFSLINFPIAMFAGKLSQLAIAYLFIKNYLKSGY